MDDAAGEAFDKVARVLGLPFPGGPHIDRVAREGDRVAIDFPRGLTGRDLSGTASTSPLGAEDGAVARWVEQRHRAGEPVPVADVAASFQEAVVDVLTKKALLACKDNDVDHLLIGAAAANSRPGARRAAVRQGGSSPASRGRRCARTTARWSRRRADGGQGP